MVAERPVFIVGEARSGSTILFRTLLKHPSFAPREENLQESSFLIQAPDAASFTVTTPRNLRRFMLEDEEEWSSFLASIRPLRPWLTLARLLGPSHAWRWRLGPAATVARSYAFHAQRARGCRRLVEKTPGHVHHIERILSCFPGARILYIHRHPVDVYSSYVRRGMVDPKADWARIGVEEFCRLYRERVRRVLRAARRRPDAVMLVRYGDFTRDPDAEMERVCRFLDEQHHPEVLVALGSEPHRWAHWERSRHLYEGIKAHTKRWQDFCGPDDARIIQERLAGEMAALGHDPYDLLAEPLAG